MKKFSFQGKNALVTGGGSGIGLEYARQLAEKGCSLCLIDINGETLNAAKNEISPLLADGASIVTLVSDLGRPEAADEVVAWLDENGFAPDVLINNAGIFDFKTVADIPPKRINTYINLHVVTVTHLSRLIGERMAARGEGVILNMSSMSCWMAMPGIALYSATKAYIHTFSRALDIELRDSGVSVLTCCPGGISTTLFGLSPRLRRMGVKTGVLYTPRRFVKGALRRLGRRKSLYINGLLNRISIVVVASLPKWTRRYGKHKSLDRMKAKSENKNANE